MRAKQLGVGGEEKSYQLRFSEPTNKLKVGSPIEFQGFQVGHVTQIEDRFDEEKQTLRSDIFALINIEAFSTKELNITQKEQVLPRLVANGLKAKLSAPLPVIGSQFIELIFDKQQAGTIVKGEEYEILPTITNKPTEDIMKQVQSFLTKLQNLPLENLLLSANGLVNENRKPLTKLLKDLDKTVLNLNSTVENLAGNLNTTVNNLNSFTSNEEFTQLPQSLNSSLYELEQTLKDLQKLSHDYSGDSKFADQLSVTFKEVSEAAQAFEKINQMLDRNANALVIGDD